MPAGHRIYLALALLVAVGGIGAAWTYTSVMRIAFLESGYPVVAAKREIIDSCGFGDIAVVGDSRPEAAVIPAALPVPAANLGMGSMTAVETFFVVRKLLDCPVRPQYVLYSHSIGAFLTVNEGLWQRAAKLGIVTYRDLREIEATARALGDPSVASVSTGDGLTGAVRDLAYTAGFPSVFTSSLVEARLFGRYATNMRILETVRRSRGHVIYPDPHSGPVVAPDAQFKRFDPSPTEAYYFDRTLALLSKAGVRALFVPVPISVTTVRAMEQPVIGQFEQFIARHSRGIAGIDGGDVRVEAWPDDMFVDGGHMNGDGAKLFSRRLADCVAGWIRRDRPGGCDFRWAAP